MDVVATWKTVSIALTGGFGILGLLTENKDKTSGRLTRWGKTSLLGIIVSTLCGVGAQLKENSDDSAKQKLATQQTLSLVKQTHLAVDNVERLLSPIDEPKFTITFTVPCQDTKYGEFCRVLSKDKTFDPRIALDPTIWNRWPGHESAILPLHFLFFRRLNGLAEPTHISNEEADLAFDVIATNYAKEKSLFASFYSRRNALGIEIYGAMPVNTTSRGGIVSFLDLSGSTMVITELNNELQRLMPETIWIDTKQGRRLEVDMSKLKRLVVDGNAAYMYSFPSETPR